jgi:fructuronate reductase
MGKSDRGIMVAATYDPEIIDSVYRPFDDLTVSVTIRPDGTFEKCLVASVAESIRAVPGDEFGIPRVKEIFREPGLQIISFTITEKGYSQKDISGAWLPEAAEDIARGPDDPRGVIAIVASGLYERFRAGAFPLALVSMDNCSKNGQKLRDAVIMTAEAWRKNGFVPQEFLSYIGDPTVISFPWSMIDKITPQPNASVQEALAGSGCEDMRIFRTSKNTCVAPFVNAEAPQYLVIEDSFPNGRPPLELAGVLFTDRKTVEQAERMKVTTCLNPLHTALAIFGCLLGFDSIAAEMADPDLKKLTERIGYGEGMPVVPECRIIDPKRFIDEVIRERLPNPFIPDTPQRIAFDTSHKIVVRFGETIKSYIRRPDLDPSSLTFIPLVIAAWFRYLLGYNDKLEPMAVSPDPLAHELQLMLKDISPRDPGTYSGRLIPLLKNTALFGADLTEVGLSGKIEEFFVNMLRGEGSVRALLHETLYKE